MPKTSQVCDRDTRLNSSRPLVGDMVERVDNRLYIGVEVGTSSPSSPSSIGAVITETASRSSHKARRTAQ